jgi:hypothetical protein
LFVYKNWMAENVPQDPFLQTAQCTKYVPIMQKVFPELRIAKGVVYSLNNPDNYGTTLKQYPHMWLVDKDGAIVDPTEMQFWLIGELIYKEFPADAKTMGRCMNCGEYFTDSKYSMLCSEKCALHFEKSMRW